MCIVLVKSIVFKPEACRVSSHIDRGLVWVKGGGPHAQKDSEGTSLWVFKVKQDAVGG